MNTPPDYSVWLDDPQHLAAEELAWGFNQESKAYALWVKRIIDSKHASSVLELGCGTGWVPLQMATLGVKNIRYTGVDGSAGCVKLARTKTTYPFIHADLRTLELTPVDIVCSFAVLKHFALHEWDAVVAKVLRHGKHGIFTMNVGRDFDDFGFGFPHTTVSLVHLREAVWKAGHEVLSVETSPCGGDAEPVVFTRAL